VLLGYFCWYVPLFIFCTRSISFIWSMLAERISRTRHKGLHLECWPADGFAWQHITRARVCAFLKVYVPAAVVSASDWWRVAAIGACSLPPTPALVPPPRQCALTRSHFI
jgi:hypothetical protein